MIRLLKILRASILFSRAGDSLERGDLILAKKQMDSARMLMGPRMSKSGLFPLDLRSALIEMKLGNLSITEERLEEAAKKLSRCRRLRDVDRMYLLDYCRTIRAEAQGVQNGIEPTLPLKSHREVDPRFIREYPMRRTNPSNI